MLKRENILEALGMTEEQVKEAKIDVDKLVKESQVLGDNIQKKYIDETTKTLTEQHQKEIAELGKTIETEIKPTKPTEDKGLTQEAITKLIADGVAEAIKPLQVKETETLVSNFKKTAMDKGYSEEQTNYFISSTKQEVLEDFNFDMFPLTKDDDNGATPSKTDPKTKDQELEDEFQKRINKK